MAWCLQYAMGVVWVATLIAYGALFGEFGVKIQWVSYMLSLALPRLTAAKEDAQHTASELLVHLSLHTSGKLWLLRGALLQHSIHRKVWQSLRQPEKQLVL